MHLNDLQLHRSRRNSMYYLRTTMTLGYPTSQQGGNGCRPLLLHF